MSVRITEQDGVHKQWYVDAKRITLETLPEFLRHLSEDYEHDYGTVCHALAAGAVATAWAMNRSPGARGGITGAQAGAVMWQFIKGWMDSEYADSPLLRLQNFADMLYPQYEYKFTHRTIPPSVWKWLQAEAAKNLAETTSLTHRDVLVHWQRILDGIVPFGFCVTEE